MSARDLDRERRFLRAAGPLAPGWVRDACQRLAAGEIEYGDSWARRGLAELLSEIAEECADIGAWSALADQALDQRTEFGEADREVLAGHILDAARKGAWAAARINHARQRLAKIDEEGER